jgi:isochorismate synthase
MKGVLKKGQSHFNENVPFVIYSKPNSNQIRGFFQKNAVLYESNDFSESGFIFTSFDGLQKILLPEKHSVQLTEEIPSFTDFTLNEIVDNESEEDKAQHLDLIQKGLQSISEGDLYKIVLARTKKVSLPTFDFVKIYKNLLFTYPSAFSYCFFHPKIGMWMGAFSEQLVYCKSNDFSTMAVAGTQKKGIFTNVIWGDKEIQEQQYVADFIIESLKEKKAEIYFSKPYTIEAGNLLHIKTDIWGKLNPNLPLNELIYKLHPTPAVCGLPKEKAKAFIFKNENHNREFYSGFLGELNVKNSEGVLETDLYVNLRCMKIENNQALVYVGGGITRDSIPEKEWMETVNKSQTMLNILAPQPANGA